MKIAIIDDEKIWLEEERRCIEKYYNKEDVQIDTYYTGEEFLKKEKMYDVIFMDIELGEEKEDGFIVAEKYQKIKNDVILIIMTTHTEFSRKGYQVNAFRYIDKTCMEAELQEALSSAENRLERKQFIEIPITGVGVQKIYCKDIVYIEASNNETEINMKSEKLICREKLKNIHKEVEDKGFYLVHRAYLANLEWIEKVDNRILYMKNGANIPISRYRDSNFKRYYFQWKLKRLNM